ncbi:Ig-like V-type domain-containing protein FAM187A [Glandiceps talaboti]
MRAAAKKGNPLPSSLQIDLDVLCSSTLDTYVLAVYLDQELRLPCRPCIKKKTKRSKSSNFKWYRQSKYEASEIPVTMGTFEGVVISKNSDLVIGFVLKSDEGKYHCKKGSQYITSYDITVFISLEEKSYGKTEGNGSSVYTIWSPWSECNMCNQPGERFRIGMLSSFNHSGDPRLCFTEGVGRRQCYIQHPTSDYPMGIPCAVDSVWQRKSHQYRRDEQLIEDCSVTCSDNDLTGQEKVDNIAPAESRKPTVPPTANRKTVYEEVGEGVAMVCPRGGVGVPVRWQNESRQIMSKYLKMKSEGRVNIDGTNALHIHKLSISDSAIYSCWLENKLLATVRLVVTGAIVVDKGVKGYLVYSGLIVVIIVILFIGVSVVRNKISDMPEKS